jgi:hypothetical protein
MIVMASKNDLKEVLRTDDVLVVQAKSQLTRDQFNLLSALVKKEEQESGLKIVVLPHSVEVKELKTDDEDDKKVEPEAKAKVKKPKKEKEKEADK